MSRCISAFIAVLVGVPLYGCPVEALPSNSNEVDQAIKSLEVGLAFFDTGKYKLALEKLNLSIGSLKKVLTLEQLSRDDKLLSDPEGYQSKMRKTFAHSAALAWRSSIYGALGDYKKCGEDVDLSLRYFPWNPLGVTNRGLLRLNHRDYIGALDDFSRAIYLDSELIEAYTNRAHVYEKSGQTQLARADRVREDVLKRKASRRELRDPCQTHELVAHLNLCELVLARRPGWTDFISRKGLILYLLGKKKEGSLYIDRAIKTDPKCARALFNKGQILNLEGAREKALELYGKALKYEPDFLDCLVRRAQIFGDEKKWSEAIEDIDAAIRIRPSLSSLHGLKALFYLSRGDNVRCISTAGRAIAIDASDFEAFVTRSAAYLAMKNYRQALADANRALEIDPHCAAALNNRGVAYRGLKRYQLAQKDFDRCLEMGEVSAQAFKNRSSLFAATGNLEQALLDFDSYESYVEKRPDSVSKKELEDESASWSRIIKVDTVNKGAYFNRGVCRLCLGLNGEAAKDFKEFLRLDGWRGRSAAYASLMAAIALDRQGLKQEARKVLDTADKRLSSRDKVSAFEFYRGRQKAQALYSNKLPTTVSTRNRYYLSTRNQPGQTKEEALKHLLWIKRNGDWRLDEYRLALCDLARSK